MNAKNEWFQEFTPFIFIIIPEYGQWNKYKESKIFISKLQKRCSPFIQTEIYLITAAWLKRRLNWESAGLPSGKSRVKKPSRTNTQGLKITEEKVLPSQWLRLDFLVFSDKDEKP